VVNSRIFKEQKNYRAPFSQFLVPSPGATIRLICPATARDRSCTDGHPTLAGPLKDYLEISYWPVLFSAGRAHELLGYKLTEGGADQERVKRDVGERDRNRGGDFAVTGMPAAVTEAQRRSGK
jgi:hypothetical protein